MVTETNNTTKKKPTYKYGEKEIDLNSYIQNLGNNVSGYLDNMHSDWSEGQREEFMNSFNTYLSGLKDQLKTGSSRFSTDNFGTITDNEGTLSNTDNDGIDPVNSQYYYNDKGERITTDDYNLLKDRKKKNYRAFQANQEVAKYFKLIGDKSKSIAEQSPLKEFNLGEHGFQKYFANKYNPGNGEWNADIILNLDQYDEATGKRLNTNRQKRLIDDITEYLNNLDENIDWEKSKWKSKEGYINFVNGLLPKINDGLTDQDYLDLGQLGLTRDFLHPFVTTERDPNITDTQREAEKKKKEEEEKQQQNKAYNDYMINLRQNGIDNITYTDSNPYQIQKPIDHYNFETGDFNSTAFSEMMGDRELEAYMKNMTTNPFQKNIDNFLGAMLARGLENETVKQVQDGKYAGMYMFDTSYGGGDKGHYRRLMYDPTKNQLFYGFMGDVGEYADQIRKKYMQDNNISSGEQAQEYSLFKEGGVIKMQHGSWTDWVKAGNHEELKERASKSGKTVKQQAASERYINSDNKSLANPNAGFTEDEWARLIAAGADVGSAVAAVIPGVGTVGSLVAGLGSTGANFIADAMDDQVSAGDMWKNLGINVGFDLAGIIPVGGAASKFAKITRSIANLAPKAIATISTIGGLANAGTYIDSWKKMGNNEKMTAEDWKNIGESITLLTGATQATAVGIKNRKNWSKARNLNKTLKDKVAVEMTDAQGNTKNVLFSGEDAKAIRDAKGNADAVKKVTIDKYADLKDMQLSLGTTRGQRSWNPKKWINTEGVVTKDVYNDDNGNAYVRKWFSVDRPTEPTTTWQSLDDAFLKSQLDPLTAASKKYEARVGKKDQRISDIDNEISSIDTNLGGQTYSQLSQSLSQLTSRKTELKNLKQYKDSYERQLKSLKKQYGKAKGSQKSALKRRIDALEKKYTNQDFDSKISSLEQKIADTPTKSRVSEVQNLELRKNRLSKVRQKWDQYKSDGKTAERLQFEQQYAPDGTNFKITDPTTNRVIEGTLADIFQKYGIKFNSGGNINKNSVHHVLSKYKSGGNIPKYKSGNTITDTRVDGTWFDLMSGKLLDVIKATELNGQYDTDMFNSLQNSYDDNLTSTQYNINDQKAVQSDAVKKRQALFNTYANALNQKFIKNVSFPKGANTNDNWENFWQDGYFGNQEYLRHFGTAESWNGNEEKLQEFQNELKKMGLDYYLDGNMYKLRQIPNNTNTPSNEPIPSAPVEKIPGKTTTGGSAKDDKNISSWKINTMTNVLDNPVLKYGLPRALYADRTNRKLTDLAKESQTPVLVNPLEDHKTVHSDLFAETQGRNLAGNLMSQMSNPFTSDAALQLAGKLDAQIKGNEFERQGNTQSNTVYNQTDEASKLQEKENKGLIHDSAYKNLVAMHATEANKNAQEQAYLAKKHNIWDTLGKEFQYNAETERLQNQTLQDALIKSDIKNHYMNLAIQDPSKLGFTPSESSLLQQMKSGKTSFTDQERQAINGALRKLSELETSSWANYKGLSRWGNPTSQPLNPTLNLDWINMGEYKRGGKVVDRYKEKNADRFQKLILESIKRNEKVLDRLSKNTISYIKDIMK